MKTLPTIHLQMVLYSEATVKMLIDTDNYFIQVSFLTFLLFPVFYYFRYEYHWCDGVNYKKPTQLPAPQYISLLMDWTESQINNEEMFPVKVGK